MKKKIVAMCATVAIAAVAVGGTLAYFTDEDSATNTFTVGNVHIDLTEDAWDALDEQDKVLAPNKTIAKDPTVTVKGGSEECYVRLLVTVEDIADFKAAFPNNVAADNTFLLENFVDWNATEWEFEECTEENGAAVYEFRYYQAVAKSASDTTLTSLFNEITIPESATNDSLAELPEVPTINIVAQAIQTQGFADADAAWNAWTN